MPLWASFSFSKYETYDLLLINKIWQRWWDLTPLLGYVILDYVLACWSDRFSSLTWWSWGSPPSKGLQVASKTWGWFLLTASRKPISPVIHPEGYEFCYPPNELGSRFFPCQFPRWEHSPAYILFAVIWGTEHRAKLCLDSHPQKLWDSKYVLFLAAKFVVICYAAIEIRCK